MRPVISHSTMCGMKEEFRQPSLVETPGRKAGGKQIFPRKERPTAIRVKWPTTTKRPTTKDDRGPSRHLHHDDNDRRQQRPTITEDDRQPTLLHRSKQHNSDPDFSIPTTRGTYFVSKHRSPHSVRGWARVRVGCSASIVCLVSVAAITSFENPRKKQ